MADGERTSPAQMTSVATRVAAICDMIQEHRRAGTTISARRAAVISAMIDDAAATAAEGRPRAFRRKRRMANARGYKQEGRRLVQGESGIVVVRARHRATGQAVAVKSLHRRSGRSHASDVLREACFTAAGGGHPSLLAFRTVARTPGTMDYSIITDYAGPSLRAVMADRGGNRPFSETEVRRVMRQLLVAAEVMHGHGIVHRDIKPENIFVGGGDDSGTVKICNYGAAKSMAEKDTPIRFAGTMEYMAPEVLARNAEHDALVDAWSLGCVMAELLTGKPPFAGKDETNQLFKIFDVLGVPCKKVWEAMKPQAYNDEVQIWRARQLRARHRNRLREMFKEDMLSTEGFQVLKGLLTCDPQKRLTAAAALRCPWFTKDVDNAPVSETDRITVITKIAAMASKFSSLAISSVGCALGLLRPKSLVQ
jgi:cell division cycle 2-like protein